MASYVRDAVGTQRQFTKQPYSTYQQNLVGVKDSSASLTAERTKQLVGALSNFSTAITTYYKDKDKRLQIYAQRAEDLINSQTDEDWTKLSAIDILNKAGLGKKLTENPYAIAIIEKGRGEYFKNKANTEYQRMISENGGYLNSAYEENKRYEKFMYDYYKNSVKSSSNDVSFARGYFGTFQKDRQTNWEAAQLKSSERQKVFEEAFLTSKADEATQNLILANDADVVNELFTPIFNSTTLIDMEPNEQIKFVGGILESLAKAGVNPEIIDKLLDMDMPPMTSRGYMTPVKVGDLLPGTSYSLANDISNLQRGTLETEQTMAGWEQMDSEQMLDSFLKMDDRDRYRYRVPFWKAWGRKRNQEKVLKQQQFQQNGRQLNSETMQAACAGIFARIEARDLEVPTNLNDWKYDFVDENGNVVSYSMNNPEQIKACLNQYIHEQIEGDKKATPEEKGERILNLINYPPLRKYAQSYTANIANALATITPEKQQGDVDYDTVDIGLNMIKFNPGLACNLLGNETYSNLMTIDALSKTFGDKQKAIDAYTKIRSLPDDARTTLDTDIKSYMKDDGFQLENTEGDSVNIGFSDPFIQNYFLKYSEAMRATGMGQEQVNEMFSNTFGENWMVFGSNLIPKAIYKHVNAIDQRGVTIQYMNDMIHNLAEQQNEDESGFNWQYNHKNGEIRLYGPDGYTISSMTIDEFTKACNDYMYQKYLKEKSETPKPVDFGLTGLVNSAMDAWKNKPQNSNPVDFGLTGLVNNAIDNF